MRILIPLLSFSKSGGGRVLSELANHWSHLGNDVTFVVANQDSIPNFATVAKIIYGNCSSIHSSVPRRMACLRRLVNERASEFDVIVANHNLTAWAVWAAGKLARSRTFYYSQAYEADYNASNKSKLRGMVLATLARRSYSLFPRTIVNAPIYLCYKEIHAIDWVPPGVDFTKFFPQDPSRKHEGNEIVIGCIGRPEPWKGTQDVFDAVRILRKMGVMLRLRSAFHGLANYDDIQDIVEIVYPADDVELGQFYRSCDVVIAPGRIQLGAPHYPVMEAMACGVPVITTGYLPATSDSAWIVPISSPSAIADSVMEIMKSPDDRCIRVSAALKAMVQFSWEAVAGKFLDIFSSQNAH